MSSPRVQLSLHYLFGFGALGALAPLLPVLWARRGFTAADISWALMLAPAANLLSPPLWGLAADRWRVRGRSLFIVCCGCALAVLALRKRKR